MARAILHIGCDKAGSGIIQRFLHQQAGALAQLGWRVPKTGLTACGGHAVLFRLGTPELWRAFLEELDGFEPDTEGILLSWEGLHHSSDQQLDALRDALKRFETTVVFYLREQAEFLQSGLITRAMNRRFPELALLDIPLDSPFLTPTPKRYDVVVDRFERAFGAGSVKLRIYDRPLLDDGDAARDFVKTVGLPIANVAPGAYSVNTSVCYEVACAVQTLDGLARTTEEEQALRRLARNHGRHVRGARFYLGRAHVDRIRSHFRQGNAAVARRFFDRDQLFDDRSVWTDEPANIELVRTIARDLLDQWLRSPTR